MSGYVIEQALLSAQQGSPPRRFARDGPRRQRNGRLKHWASHRWWVCWEAWPWCLGGDGCSCQLGHKCHKNHTKKSGKWLNISLFPIDCCEKFQGSVQAMICFHAIFLRSWPWSTGICFQRSSHHETQRGQMSREISLTREHTWQDFVGGERMVRACVHIPWCSHNSSELDDSQVFFPHTVLKLVADSPQAAWDCIPRARLEVSNYCVYRVRRERQSSLVKNYRYLVAELYIMCISLCRFRYIYFFLF